jgi:Tfp pilus assembly protein PilN
MAVKLNLLPTDYTLTGPVRQLVKAARSLNVIFLALFLVAVLCMGGFFIFSSISLNSLATENNNLKSQIQAQTAAQQQIVLLKDRLTQIKTVQDIPGAAKSLVKIDPILTLIKDQSLLSELDVDSQKTVVSAIFKSNSDLTNFFRSLDSNSDYSTISLGTFNYSQTEGYQVSLSFTKK